jgi:hypothetical protein
LGFTGALLRPLLGSATAPLDNTLLMTAAALQLEGLLRFKGLGQASGRWIFGVAGACCAAAALGFAARWVIAWQAAPGTDLLLHPVPGAIFLLLLVHDLAWTFGMSLALNLRVQERLPRLEDVAEQALRLADRLPQVRGRIEFGAVRRQDHQPHVGRQFEFAGDMPACLVHDHEDELGGMTLATSAGNSDIVRALTQGSARLSSTPSCGPTALKA